MLTRWCVVLVVVKAGLSVLRRNIRCSLLPSIVQLLFLLQYFHCILSLLEAFGPLQICLLLPRPWNVIFTGILVLRQLSTKLDVEAAHIDVVAALTLVVNLVVLDLRILVFHCI